MIAPDLLGHGRSEKPRADYSVAGFANGMRDLLSVLEVDRVTVVGHSLGGGVAAQFAYQFPDRCERLVLVGSGGVGRTVSPLLRVAAVPGIEALMPLLGLPPSASPAASARGCCASSTRRSGATPRRSWPCSTRCPTPRRGMVILRTLRSSVDWQGQVITMVDRAYLAEGVPTLIVWGRRDAIIPLGHGRLIHTVMPGSELEVFDEAGHFPHHTDPARFVRVLREFMERSTPARYDPGAVAAVGSGGAEQVDERRPRRPAAPLDVSRAWRSARGALRAPPVGNVPLVEHAGDEEVLHGGVANQGQVVRVGPHVLRPSNPHSLSIFAFLRRCGPPASAACRGRWGSTPTGASGSSTSRATRRQPPIRAGR